MLSLNDVKLQERKHWHHSCGRATPRVQTSQHLLKVYCYPASHHMVGRITL